MKRHILNMVQFLFSIFLLLILISFSFKKQSFKYCSINKINISQQQNKFLSSDIIINYLDSLSIYPSLTRLDSISLHYIESSLSSHPLVKEANVFSDINGLIDIDLTSRNPIARIRSAQEYYVDDEGKEMPLSSQYSSRVLVVLGDLTYIDTSIISRVNNNESVKVDNHFVNVFNTSKKIFDKTKGKFDPSIGTGLLLPLSSG